jgi:cephalosporin hydroxylase
MIDIECSWQQFADAGYGTEADGRWVEKLPDDLDRYRRLIQATEPEVIVETGTRRGGSAAWFAQLGVDVVTVDLASPHWSARSARVAYVRGDSAADSTAASVAELVSGRRCMVSLDSDHHAGHVLAEIGQYARLVSAGCYLVVEDGICDLLDAKRARHFGASIPERGGPLKAAMMALAGYPDWVRDYDLEQATPLTHHPAGWWRRAG